MTMPNVNINEKNNEVKNQIEIRFSCGEDNISKYIDDGWNIVKKSTEQTALNYWLQINNVDMKLDLPITWKLTHLTRKEIFKYS